MNVDYKCPHCGSYDLNISAFLDWDAGRQFFYIDTVDDHASCGACEESFTMREAEIEYEK
jgi:transcription elongation factor Elf1